MSLETAREKESRLAKRIRELGSVLVAFSGGVDSTYLLSVSRDALGEKDLLAVTATSSTYPDSEMKEAGRLAKTLGVRHRVISSEELDIEGFRENPPDRCYYCKGELFTKLREVAESESLAWVVDGSNYDDAGDYRPGMRAAKEKKVLSPLKETELTKAEIRLLSRQKGLPTWNKPAYACLASRFPYGDSIDSGKLRMVEKAEECLKAMGFTQVRVRHHGEIARIEVSGAEINNLLQPDTREAVARTLKNIGFTYVAVDMEGYRTGSMNETFAQNRVRPV